VTTRPLKTAEDFCNASTTVAGAMQLHAYAGSIATTQLTISPINSSLARLIIMFFFEAANGTGVFSANAGSV
jgi:hypothetical protein